LFNIILDKATLDHGDQIAVVIGHYESHRTPTPGAMRYKLIVKPTMLGIAGIKDHIGSTVKF
jgi:hypothetical protein